MFRYYANIVLAVLLVINVFLILSASLFVKKVVDENPYDRLEKINKLKKIFYLVFFGLLVLFLLINLIF